MNVFSKICKFFNDRPSLNVVVVILLSAVALLVAFFSSSYMISVLATIPLILMLLVNIRSLISCSSK